MTIEKEWKKHMAAVLVAVEKSTEPGTLSKKEALGFMTLLIEEVEVRQDALVEELEEDEDESQMDEELLEAADAFLDE